MTVNPFIEQYTKLSNSELLKIIDSEGDYQSLAIEAAQEILNSRKLSEQELTEAREKIELEYQLAQTTTSAIAGRKINSFSQLLIDACKPIPSENKSKDIYILILCLTIIISFIYKLLENFNSYFVTDFDITGLSLTFLGLLSAVMFWRKTKIGWILLSVVLTFSTLIQLIILISSDKNGSLFLTLIDVSPYLIALIFICLRSVRSIYKVSFKTMSITLGVAIAATALFWFFSVN